MDMRCRDCQEIGCECPRGYVADAMECVSCGYRFVLSAAVCAVYRCRCPVCAGEIEVVDATG